MLIRRDVSLASAFVAMAFLFTVSPRGHLAVANDHVVIVLDDSGSMNQNSQGGVRRMDAAKRALEKVIAQIPDDTNVGIMLLNGARANNHWLVPLGPLDKRAATARVNKIAANGSTPLGEAMRQASDQLLQARSKSVYGAYRLIVVTDGEATDQALLDQYLPDILSRGLIVDAIGVNMQGSHSLATKVHSYRRADDEAALSNAIVEILAENSGRDAGATDADFELLNALNEVDAGEILKALAAPNNDSVTGYRPVPPTPDTVWTPSGPATVPATVPTNPPPEASGLVSIVFGTFCTCMLPILVAIMIFITVASSGKRKRNR